MQLADRLYIFCPDYPNGIEFCLQEISENIAKLIGGLKPNCFLSSREKEVDWNEEINGERSNISKVGSTKSQLINVNGDSYTATTIVVDRNTFENLVRQIQNPTIEKHTKYKMFDVSRQDKNLNNKNKEKVNNYIKQKRF